MPAIRITNFGGIIPRLANRLLPENAARTAANCTVLSGELRPMRKPKKVYEPALATSLKSMFRVDDTTWFAWPIDYVQMVRAPIEGVPRYCYTGDGVPKVAKKPVVTFSRASTATYFDSSGVLRTAAVDVPRLNYDPSDLSKAPSYLVEPAATNLLTYSDQLDNIVWAKWQSSILVNVTTAPDGSSTADKIVENLTNNSHTAESGCNVVSGTTYTFSCFVKSVERNFAYVGMHATGFGTELIADFNLTYKTLVTTSAGSAATIQDVGGGWLRLSISATAVSTGYCGFYIGTSRSSGAIGRVYTGDGVSGIHAWGAQIEIGATATSYIPTTTAPVTRAADIYDYGITVSGSPDESQTLGIPTPVAAATVTSTGGTGANATRFYVYTFYSENNEESSPSPASSLVTGKVDATWSITGMDVAPSNTGAITSVTKTSSAVTLTLSGNHYFRPTDLVAISGVLGMTDLNGSWPIDSVPSNNQITINLATAQTYTSGGTWLRAVPWGNCTKRLYRTSSGSKADFQLVALDITGSSFTDTLTDLQIPGDSIVSEGWVPPPPNMIGMITMSNGVLAGFYDNTVCMSEPYQPHAWPTAYRRKMTSTIVGIASFDTNIGVATVGNPVVLTGSDPDQMIPVKHNKSLPCLSRASVCGVGDGVIYASKNGLVKMDISDAGMFTSVLFGPEEWNRLVPSTTKLAFDGTKLYLSTESGVVYIFNTVEGGALTTTNQVVDGMYADETTGDLFFAFAKKVYVLESFTSAPLTTDWWSRENVLPFPVNFGAVKIEIDSNYAIDAAAAILQEQADAIASNVTKISTIGGRGGLGARVVNAQPINGSFLDPIPTSTVSVSFSLYAKEQLIYTGVLQNGVIARLPAGYKSDTFSVRLQANTQVKAVTLADTPGNLRNA